MFSQAHNFDFEIQKAKNASLAGKKVVLFVGRGSKQGVRLQEDSKVHFCFLSPLRENFFLKPSSSYSELIVSLNSLPLDKIGKLFDEIIIDGGTLHHLLHELRGDQSNEIAALELSVEILFGDFFEASRVAASPHPIIYQVSTLSLAYHELFLRRLASVSRYDLKLLFPYGEEKPWRQGSMQNAARILQANANSQINELSLLTWYLMSRKEAQFILGEEGRGAGYLPRDLKIKDLDSEKNNGALMFSGSLGFAVLPAFKPELKSSVTLKK